MNATLRRIAGPLVVAALAAGCSSKQPEPAGTLHYKVSGTPGTPVTIEYYGTAVRPGDRRFGQDVILKEVVLPREGFLRYWGKAEPGGIASMNGRTRDTDMRSCITLEIQMDDRTLREEQSCLKSYAVSIRAEVPAKE